MKKVLFLYSIPIFIQILLIPFWLLNLDARYIDASVVSLFVSILTPIYLIVINLIQKHFVVYGITRIHLLMVGSVCLAEFFSYLGWSKFNIERFMNPDPMTVGLSMGFVKMGLYMIMISVIVSLSIKFVKSSKNAK